MEKISVAQEVKDFITPIVEGLGYILVDVEYAKKQNGMNLTVFIDSPQGIMLDDCEKVHLAIDAPLDELDPTKGASYTLNVSSPGLDRPIKTDKQLSANIGKVLDVSTYTKVLGEKQFSGTLLGFTDDEVIIGLNDSTIALERKNIAKITKHIDF